MLTVNNNFPNGAKSNYCRHHATFDLEHLKTHARTLVGGQTRKTQDDKILCRLLQESLWESAHKITFTDRSAHTISGEECCLLMLKAILERSSVDTNTDPDVLRDELTRAADKFGSLQCDVKKFNEWFREKVEKLKQNSTLDSELNWLHSPLFDSTTSPTITSSETTSKCRRITSETTPTKRLITLGRTSCQRLPRR